MTDLTLFQGDSKTLEVTVEDVDGNAVDLTSAQSIRWHMARSVNAEAVLEKSVGSGVTVISAADGRFNVTLDSSDTESLSGGFYHEAEVILSDGTVATVLTGSVAIERTLIKPEA